jgi:AbrB family looped-hinge helix DNA binding protein
MAKAEATKIGRRGTFVIPARLRKRFRLDEGSLVVAEEREDGILIRPAVVLPVEIYTDERIAEFLLTNAINAKDYAAAVKEVRRMGLDPAKIDHVKPRGA